MNDLPAVTVFTGPDEGARAAAQRIIDSAALAIITHGVFHLGLSGGSTPRQLFSLLAEQPRQMNWGRVQVWWADERCLPPGHPESNYGAAYELLLRHVAPQVVHRILGETGCYDAAEIYEWELHQTLAGSGLDLLLLGVGSDGHTASLFPGHPVLDETKRWAVPVPHTTPPDPPVDRVSLSLPLINRSRQVIFLAGGESKRAILQQVLANRGPQSPYPAGRVLAPHTEWLLDSLPGFGLLTTDNKPPSSPQV